MSRAPAPREVPPPLELLCLRALWSLGEGNVRHVQEAIAGTRTLAYTTVMTLLERLARKGVLTRRKVGRAFVYVPVASREAMRQAALKEFLEGHFDGSVDLLREFLRARPAAQAIQPAQPAERLDAVLL